MHKRSTPPLPLSLVGWRREKAHGGALVAMQTNSHSRRVRTVQGGKGCVREKGEEYRRMQQGGAGALDRSEKTIDIMGDKWRPQMTKQKDDTSKINKLFLKKHMEETQ